MGASTGNASFPEKIQKVRAQREAALNQRRAASMAPGVEPDFSGIGFDPGRSRRLVEEIQRMRAQKRDEVPGAKPDFSGVVFGPGRSRRLEGNR
jgi:hypothetical protein